MIVRNAFRLSMPVEQAWPLLLDVPTIAGCVPGAELTSASDNTFEGTVGLRVGPLSLQFAGQAVVEARDHEARRAQVRAKGADRKGRGGAQAAVTFQCEPDAEANGTRVSILTDLALAGPLAQYGRAAGMMEAIAQKIIDTFVTNLEARLRNAPEHEVVADQGASGMSALSLAWTATKALAGSRKSGRPGADGDETGEADRDPKAAGRGTS